METPTKRIVVLVQCLNGIHHPALLFQVTLDPDRVWPNSEFIRFGFWSDNKGAGDELTGWMKLSEWQIAGVLGDLMEDGKTVKCHSPSAS